MVDQIQQLFLVTDTTSSCCNLTHLQMQFLLRILLARGTEQILHPVLHPIGHFYKKKFAAGVPTFRCPQCVQFARSAIQCQINGFSISFSNQCQESEKLRLHDHWLIAFALLHLSTCSTCSAPSQLKQRKENGFPLWFQRWFEQIVGWFNTIVRHYVF